MARTPHFVTRTGRRIIQSSTDTTNSRNVMHYVHGAYKGNQESPEHGSWRRMLDRCYRTKSKSWHGYGGRGIKVCERWQRPGGFVQFLSDMGIKPSQIHTLERIDNDGDYTPKNCRWATPKEQMNNRRNNTLVTIQGETHTQAQWLEILRITRPMFLMRYRGIRRKWIGKLGRFERAGELQARLQQQTQER